MSNGPLRQEDVDVSAGRGGVLSDVEIRRAIEAKELIVKCKVAKEALRPAAYDVLVAPDGLITPKGKKVPPGGDGRRPRKVVLEPGDAALLSTAEEFRLPLHIAGNITIKNRFATQGLLLLAGMLIDPGYGWDDSNRDSGSRLYLHVANVGKQTVEIRPHEDRIASIQFLLVNGDHDEHTHKVPGSEWADQTLPSLGFLTDMKKLKEQVERTDVSSKVVITLGFVVLAVALISTSITTALSLAQKHGAITDLHRLEAHTKGVLLFASIVVLLFILAWGIGNLVRAIARTLRRCAAAIRRRYRAQTVNQG